MRYATRAAAAAALLSVAWGCADLITDIFEYGAVEVGTMRRNGDPVPGTTLLLYTGQGVRDLGTTDGAGRHVFDQVPPENYGVYAEPPEGYARLEELLGGPSTAQVDRIVLAPGGREAVSFTYLKEGPGSITVSAREPGGAAIPEAVVSVFSPTATWAEEKAGSAGEVTFPSVPFGNWGVRVAPPETYLGEGETVFERDGILIEDGVTEVADFVLEKCLGTIRARVSTPEGRPVSGFPVRLYQGGGTLEEGETSASGERPFGPLLCRTFGVALNPQEGWEYQEGPGLSWQDGLRVTRSSDQTVDFTVVSCSGLITGRVRDRSGRLLPGATLTLFTAGGNLEDGITGAEGSHTFNPRTCQDHGLRVSTPPPGHTVPEGRGLSFYDGIRARGTDPVVLSFTADRCIGDIRVAVRDQGGAPVPGASLFFYTGAGDLAHVVTGLDGTRTFTPPTCGLEYGVRLNAPQGYTVTPGRGTSYLDGLRPLPSATAQVTFVVTAN